MPTAAQPEGKVPLAREVRGPGGGSRWRGRYRARTGDLTPAWRLENTFPLSVGFCQRALRNVQGRVAAKSSPPVTPVELSPRVLGTYRAPHTAWDNSFSFSGPRAQSPLGAC